MALTLESIRANEALASLTDEQAAAIIEINNTEVGSIIGEVHRKYDETILRSTGVSRDGDEKSYVYLERAATAIRSQAEQAANLQKERESLITERDNLLEQVKGGNPELQRQLEDRAKELADVTSRYQQMQEQLTGLEEKHKSEMHAMKVESTLQNATSGLKFKHGVSDGLVNLALKDAMAKVQGYNPTFDETGKLVFKDENGIIIKDGATPKSAQELLKQALNSYGVLEEAKKQSGAGTSEFESGSGDGGNIVDLSTAKTKGEAYNIIHKSLMAQGLTRGTEEFDKARVEVVKANSEIMSKFEE